MSTTQLRWLDPQHLDTRDVSGAVAVLEAARRVDSPQLPPTRTSRFTAGLLHGWDGDPTHGAVLCDERGVVVGVLQVVFPEWDNRHIGLVEICVDPAARRRGHGRTLYEAAVARVRAAGRTTVVGDGWDTPGGVVFATSLGLKRASDEVQRQQRPPLLDWVRLAADEQAAGAASQDYELQRITGPTPDHLVDVVVELTGAINDAPIDDLSVEDEVFSPARLKAFDDAQAAYGLRVRRLVARHRETGAPAGHTVVAVDQEFPWFALQYDTSVLRGHRGHRLGLRLKLEMLRWLQVEEPQLQVIETWNAASNKHMIAVNEQLGYEVVAAAIAWQQEV